jgi:hypothetical protein
MKQCLAVTIGLIIASNSFAKCVYRPHVAADVLVTSCESVVFGASSSISTDFDPGGSPLYKEGNTLSGTFMAVTVKKSWFVWTDLPDHRTNGFNTWAKGETRSLFIAAPWSSTCPKALPATLKVVTTDVCCDMFPLRDECLVPTSVSRVNLTP